MLFQSFSQGMGDRTGKRLSNESQSDDTEDEGSIHACSQYG